MSNFKQDYVRNSKVIRSVLNQVSMSHKLVKFKNKEYLFLLLLSIVHKLLGFDNFDRGSLPLCIRY
jgi:hypothetical protein